MAPARNFATRIEALESVLGTAHARPKINLTVLGADRAAPLLGYRIGTGAGAADVLRLAGETDAELGQRARAVLDDKAEEGNVHIAMELRGQ
jgi:hypothetical protein